MSEEKIISRFAPVILTRDDIAEYAKELARCNQRLQETENNKQVVVADFQAQIKKIKADIESISARISSGIAYKPVECIVSLDYEKQVKKIIRKDTGEIISEERLINDDVQTVFKGDIKTE